VLSDWFVVSTVADARNAGLTIEATARRLETPESTVYRVSRRLLGCSPGDVDAEMVLAAAKRWTSGPARRQD
jgi:AraC-like DNA-binding protein